MSDNFTRRGFLAASGGALAGSCVPAAAASVPSPPQESVRDWLLDVEFIEKTLGGTRVRLRSYGGQVPGPLFEARPGDTLRIRVRNHLTEYDSSAWDGEGNVPHSLNTTNLHLHGLEIMPHLFESDDPTAKMIAIEPGGERGYEFKIPDNQPAGLFWYHPHHHGSTAVQVVSGMAGGLIVRGPIDDVCEIAAAREIVLVLQDIGLFPSPSEPGLWEYNPPQNAIWDTMASRVRVGAADAPVPDPDAPVPWSGFTTGDYPLRYYLINGEPYFQETHNRQAPREPRGTQMAPPRYSLRPGEVVRFRVLNGNSDNLMPIAVEGHDVHLIALDGVNFPEPRPLRAPDDLSESDAYQILMAPGNRAEFLLKASATEGTYRIIQQPQDQQFLNSERKVIATFVVEGRPKDMPLPAELPQQQRHPYIGPGDWTERHVVMSATFPATKNRIVGMDLEINDELYVETEVEDAWTTHVGAIEQWTISVPDSEHGGNEGHPFHIHVNSFQVVSIGGVDQPEGTFMDTIWVHQDSDVVIRMRFDEWTGKSLFHCHILPHEDTGMMKNFLILPAPGG